ncbi:MAG: tetratricopeptide repeat protein [Candidatus Hydrogenedentota bacterium]
MNVNQTQGKGFPPIWNITFPRISQFADAHGVLETIHERLESAPICILEASEALDGNPGVTSMAREFAYRQADNYQAIWWLEGGHEAALALKFTQLAVSAEMGDAHEDNPFHTVDEVKQWLALHEGWLLVFDDLADPAIIDSFLPDPVMGHVLITTHHPSPETDVSKVIIEPLDLASFIDRYEAFDVRAEQVPALLPHSPYALDMLAATALHSDYTMPQMLSTIGQALDQLDAPGYDDALQMVIRYPLSVIASQIPAAKDFLALCCFLAPNDIPRFLFRDGEGIVTTRLARILNDDKAFLDMATLLCDFGILSQHQDLFTIHPSFQRVLRAGMDEKPAKNWINAVMKLLEQAFPTDATFDSPSTVSTQLIPHLLGAVEMAEDCNAALPLASTLLYQAGLYLHACDLQKQTQMCYLRSINIAERKLGTVHPAVATRVNSLGIVEHQLGNLNGAQACFERAIEICESLYGTAKEARYSNIHDSMLTMPLRNLCMILEEKGEVKRAQRAFEKAMKTFVEVYGWNHSVVAECAHCFGNTWMKLENYPKAQNCFLKAVRAEENAHVCDNEVLAIYLNSLGVLLLHNNDAEGAVEHLERALRLGQNMTGNEDPRVRMDLLYLGHAYREVGRLSDAETSYREALTLLERDESTEQDYEMAKLLTNLGIVMLGQQQHGQARIFLEQALAMQTELNGEDAVELVSILVNLGKAMDGLEAPSQAKDLYNRALSIIEAQSADNYSDHATILYRLGRSCEIEREYESAINFYEQAMNMDTRHLGKEHPHVGRDAAGVGSVLAHQGDTIVAMGHLTLALDIYEGSLGKDHPKTRAVRKKLDKISH